MRINHNIPALNTLRLLNTNNNNLANSMERLSSGLNEMSEILQRMRELAVQSANGTNTDKDRDSIQVEVDQLLNELGRISTSTEFNTLSLLDGKLGKEGTQLEIGGGSLADIVGGITGTGGINDKYEYGGEQYASAVIDFSNLTSEGAVSALEGKGVHYTCATCSKAYSIKFVKGDPDISRLHDGNPIMEVSIDSVEDGTELANKIKETAYGNSDFTYNPKDETNVGSPNVPDEATSFVNHYSQIDAEDGKLYIYDNRKTYANNTWPNSLGYGQFNHSVYGEEKKTQEDKVLIVDIQAGSNKGQMVRVEILNVTLERLGIEDLSLASQEEASLAIPIVDKAIDRVLRARSIIGAYQNRFEHKFNCFDRAFTLFQFPCS